MPRILTLTTLPHSRPTSNTFERVNGKHRLRLRARHHIGLPYGVYPRVILVYLTTAAIRSRSPVVELGPTPNEFARALGLTPISGKRGTVPRLQDQLERLLTTRLSWYRSDGVRADESCSAADRIQEAWFCLAWTTHSQEAEPGGDLGSCSVPISSRRSRSLFGPCRPAIDSQAEHLPAIDRPLRLAHTPHELPASTSSHPMGCTPFPIRQRLWPDSWGGSGNPERTKLRVLAPPADKAAGLPKIRCK